MCDLAGYWKIIFVGAGLVPARYSWEIAISRAVPELSFQAQKVLFYHEMFHLY